MVVFRFVNYGTVLGTRSLGAQVREDLLNVLAEGDKVGLDFSGVEIVSNGFADECLGSLLLLMPIEELNNRTTFLHLSGFPKTCVSAALRRKYNSYITKDLFFYEDTQSHAHNPVVLFCQRPGADRDLVRKVGCPGYETEHRFPFGWG